MSVASTREVMNRYFESGHSGLDTMADDVVFMVMGTGQVYYGKDGVAEMLDYFYHVAFHATPEPRSMVYGEDNAVGEWDFVGKHIGEFAGVPPTGKSVRVPLCVAYDLENDKIKRGRVYFEIPIFLEQIGMAPASAIEHA